MITTIRAGLLLGVGMLVGGVLFAFAANTSTNATSAMKRGQEMKMKLQEIKKEAETKRMSARQELQAKVRQFKDEKKKQAAEALYDRLQKANETWTEHFSNMLDKYGTILDRVNARKSSSSADLAVIDAAAQNASNAIAAARIAVETQAKKIYSVSVASETGVRAAFQNAHKVLKSDLFALRDGAIKSAREAVQKALQSLRPASPANGASSR